MSFARALATVGMATLVSRLLGFARDIGIAALLGAGGAADAFFAAFQVANLFRRLLAEGALNAALVPLWVRLRAQRGPAAAQRLGEEALGALLIALGALGVVCTVFAPAVAQLIAPGFAIGDPRLALAEDYLRLAAPYTVIAGLVALAAAIVNAEGRVAAAAWAVVAFNVVLLLAIGALAFVTEPAHAGAILSGAIVIAGLAQLIVVGAALLRLPDAPLRPRLPQSPETRLLFTRALPGIVAAGIPQLKLIAGVMIASASPAGVSWLYYAYRLYELPLGVISVASAAVIVPMLAASLRAGPRFEKEAQARAIAVALGLTLPAAAGLILLADPIVAALFQRGAFDARDTAAVAAVLAAICAGLPGHALERVLGAVAFAHEDTRTPMRAGLVGLAVAALGGAALFPLYGPVGVAAAIAASGWIGAALLAVPLARQRRLHVAGHAALAGIVASTFAMAVALIALRAFLTGTAGLAALIGIGLALYLALLQATGVARIADLVAAVRKSV